MESPDFLFYTLHAMGAVTCPLQILGIYCILYKTPHAMSSAKWVLLNAHIWSLIFDITITELIITFLVFPVIGAVPLGILTKWLDVPIAVLVSDMLIFENRYYQLFGKHKTWRHFRIPMIVINYGVVATFMLPTYLSIPDDHKFQASLPSSMNSMNFFIWAKDYQVFLKSLLFITIFELIQFVPLIMLTDWNVRTSIRKSTQSRQTMQLQLKFLMTLYAQSGAFFLACFTPYVYILYPCFTNYYNPIANNYIFIFVASRGSMCTLILLFAYKPYKRAVISIFRRLLPSWCSTQPVANWIGTIIISNQNTSLY
nr:hypothetical protein K10G4.7 - Caenorhabditis elegans [Caenorhabditis elegans]